VSIEAARATAMGLALAMLVASCGGGAASTGATATAAPQPLNGTLTVLAAASLSRAFTATQAGLERDHPGLTLRLAFAGSQQLVSQVGDGAPADLIATADTASMQKLADAGLIGPPRIFARNTLEIAVAPGNPRQIRGLSDLARPGLAVVLADPSVPAGKFAKQALAAAGVTVTPKAYELDVESVLRTVASGDADAAIVYSTDVRSSAATVDGVVIPAAQNVIASYPIAVVNATKNHRAATAYVAEVLTGAIHADLLRRGFLSP
jgi:molybdate transport system substrate-binding protein